MLLVATIASGQISAPDTPAGHTLESWLTAVNSLDRGQIRAYIEEFEPGLSQVDMLQLGEITGGFDLSSIEESEPTRIVYFLTERETGTRRLGKLELEQHGAGVTVISHYLWVTPPGSRLLGFDIDAATRDAVVVGAADKLRESHIHPAVGASLADELERRHRLGEYDDVTDGELLADMLEKHIHGAGGDTHIGVRFIATLPPERPSESPVGEAQRPIYQKLNCFVRRAEVLPGNIGYLKLDGFENPDLCGPTVSAAMTIVQHVDALIIDLRESTGGWPSMVAYTAGYFFAEPTHLIDMRTPSTNTVEQHWTPSYLPGQRLVDTPIYLLTSPITHSASEMFVDSLRTRDRATVVGERTQGGAQETDGHRLSEQFGIGVPSAEAINPITNGNWSGVGVEPDVPVAADDALQTALDLISQQIEP